MAAQVNTVGPKSEPRGVVSLLLARKTMQLFQDQGAIFLSDVKLDNILSTLSMFPERSTQTLDLQKIHECDPCTRFDPKRIGFLLMAIKTNLGTVATSLVWKSGHCVVLGCKSLEETKAAHDILARWLVHFVVEN